MEKRQVRLGNITLGEGRPKVFVSLMARDKEELLGETLSLADSHARGLFDILEWRMDFFAAKGIERELSEAAGLLRGRLPHIPLLATFRTKKEGGEGGISPETYRELLLSLIEGGQVDALDIELFLGDVLAKELICACHSRGIYSLLSSHDFIGTPPQEEMRARLFRMRELGADIGKLAVMPRTKRDVLELFSATEYVHRVYENYPLITIAMGELGKESRYMGHFFGSAATFAHLGQASAPGQVEAERMKQLLDVLFPPVPNGFS